MLEAELSIETVAYPMPCSLVGANIKGKPNYLTVAFFTMVNIRPLQIAISLGKTHYTNIGIRENKAFSVNIPSRDMADVADYCGIVSGRKYNKAKRFETFYGKLGTAPMIAECPCNLECELVQVVELPSNDLFIGEIVSVFTNDSLLTDGKPDMKKTQPILLSMTDSMYYAIGNRIGKAWEIGKGFLPEKEYLISQELD